VPIEKVASRFFEGIRTPTTNRLVLLADCLDFRKSVKAGFSASYALSRELVGKRAGCGAPGATYCLTSSANELRGIELVGLSGTKHEA
jgi:hypothetical protein